MRLRQLLRLLILATAIVMLLVACGGEPVPQAGTGPTTSAPVSRSTPTDGIAPTAPQTPTTFAGLASGLDNIKQARIRAVSLIWNGSPIDVSVNDLPVVNGGKLLQNIDAGSFSGWVYVTPGTYTVALVPHGGTAAQALFAPVALDAAAGHRYTVAAMGHLKAKNVTPLVIDETALEASIGTKATDRVYIDINSVEGIAGIDHMLGGKLTTVKTGAAQAVICPNDGSTREIITVAGKPETVLASADFSCGFAVSSAAPWYGDYPSNFTFGDDSQATSELNTLDFLAEFNSRQIVGNGQVPTFTTVLAAIEKARMRDQFITGGPYFFFVPTDQAFAALPAAQRDALLTDSQALTALLKTHLVDGYYPYGSLSGATYGQTDRDVVNLLGQQLRLLASSDGISINGMRVRGPNYTIGNGNRLQFIDKLLPVK